jgi:hypothetical protein
MALALMISARKFAKENYQYIIFSDRETLPYYETPEWLKVVKLGSRYYKQDSSGSGSIRLHSFLLKSLILSDEVIEDCDALYLDSDCYVFRDSFEDIFKVIDTYSMAIYGEYLPEGEIWGKINFPEVASKAGFTVRNMWLNGGFIGRAANQAGMDFIKCFESMISGYPLKPYMPTKFWQYTDEPYIAIALQLTAKKHKISIDPHLPSPSSNLYITTYDAEVDFTDKHNPVVHSNYVKGTYQPGIIHFLNGMDISSYRELVNKSVQFNLEGKLLRPYFRSIYIYKKLKYYYKRLTDSKVTEAKDA